MREHYLVKLPFWEKLSVREQDFMEQKLHTKRYEKGMEIYLPDHICLAVMKGELKVYALSDEGREINLTKLHPDNMGVLNTSIMFKQSPDEFGARATQDCELLVMDVAAFKKIVDSNIYVRCFWFEVEAKIFSDAMTSYKKALLVSIDRRVAGFIIDYCAEKETFTLKVTAQDIANEINSVREVVTRMLNRFKKEGMVEVSRGTIKVTDLVRLKRIADR